MAYDGTVETAPFTPPINTHRTAELRSYLYVMRSGEFIKIGIADDVARRHRSLEAGNPHKITVVAIRSCPRPMVRQVEQRLHAMFAAHAVGREWFRDLEPEVVLKAAAPVLRRAETYLRSYLERVSRIEPTDAEIAALEALVAQRPTGGLSASMG